MKRLITLLLALSGGFYGLAQDDIRIGLMPQINLNYSLGDNWKINSKTESRQIFWEGLTGEELPADYRYERTDIDVVITRKTGVLGSVGGGYMIRFQNGEIIHRLIQQYTLVQRFEGFRLGHRLRTDQTFRSEDPIEFRIRYRLSLEKPLRGNSVDPNELYLKLNNEALLALQDGDSEWEYRLVPNLGYFFTDRNKLEAGFDFRANQLFQNVQDYQFWCSVGWYYTLN